MLPGKCEQRYLRGHGPGESQFFGAEAPHHCGGPLAPAALFARFFLFLGLRPSGKKCARGTARRLASALRISGRQLLNVSVSAENPAALRQQVRGSPEPPAADPGVGSGPRRAGRTPVTPGNPVLRCLHGHGPGESQFFGAEAPHHYAGPLARLAIFARFFLFLGLRPSGKKCARGTARRLASALRISGKQPLNGSVSAENPAA